MALPSPGPRCNVSAPSEDWMTMTTHDRRGRALLEG
jgi:hypothetical protein